MAITVGSHGLIEDEIVWKVPQGADARTLFRLFDDDEKTTPTDLTGYTGACEVRRKAGGELLGEAIVTLASGVVDVHLPAATSESWSAKTTTAVFDVELYGPDGETVRLCSGRLDIAPNITTGE